MKEKLKNPVLRGTIILTLSGMLVKVIGFFYKIFLSKLLGSYYLGIYQMIFPVFGVCFTIYASGIQTAISSLVAQAPDLRASRIILKKGCLISVSCALCLSAFLYLKHEWIAARILLEPACAPSLRYLALVFPFCGISSCINGFYYGLKKSFVPAFSQILEQLSRVFCVFLISTFISQKDPALFCCLAVFGLFAGEMVSCVYNLFSLHSLHPRFQRKKGSTKRAFLLPLFHLALPLTLSRLCINILHSAEAVLIPFALRSYGLTQTEAISTFGILNGMALSVILFPSSIPNSVCVLLLPSISNARKEERNLYIRRQCENAVHYSLIIGLLFTLLFLLGGKWFGMLFFHEPAAGKFICLLSFLCPFLYLSMTLGSILNGLGKTMTTFTHTLTGLVFQIIAICLLVPRFGIICYPFALLLCHMIISLSNLHSLKKMITFRFHPFSFITGLFSDFSKKL